MSLSPVPLHNCLERQPPRRKGALQRLSRRSARGHADCLLAVDRVFCLNDPVLQETSTMPITLANPALSTHAVPHPFHTLTDTPSAQRPVPPLSELLRPEPARTLPLIVHSHLRWGPGSERPRQIFSRLSTHHPVLFVEPPMYGALDTPALQWSEPHPNVCRAIPLLPLTLQGGEDVQRAAIAALLEAWMRGQTRAASPPQHGQSAPDRRMTERFQGAVQWFCSPMDAPSLIGRFGTVGAVYDRAGALAHPQRSAPDFAERDRSLVRQAHLVFFTTDLGNAARIPRARLDGNGQRHAHRHGHGHGSRFDHDRASGPTQRDPAEARARRAVWDGVVGCMRQRLRVTFEADSPARLPPAFIAASAAAFGLH